ncbi:hypothetical protein [Streptomyces phaeochromogenes]|uniref:hypothetical protein n=1 Tax=Streptomyces phaeochromogenes TaxID=1923 RepID=UPI00371367FE
MSRRGGQEQEPGSHEAGAVPKKRERRSGSGGEERPLAPVRVTVSKQERVLYVGCEGESTRHGVQAECGWY